MYWIFIFQGKVRLLCIRRTHTQSLGSASEAWNYFIVRLGNSKEFEFTWRKVCGRQGKICRNARGTTWSKKSQQFPFVRGNPRSCAKVGVRFAPRIYIRTPCTYIYIFTLETHSFISRHHFHAEQRACIVAKNYIISEMAAAHRARFTPARLCARIHCVAG